ncbi:type IV pilin [Halorubellus sp. JP-L1]|uniref:type IV pilin n=1 Tax=Halorubellus sp. JP-L1 TaxID=2715753 RepID=UPI00140CA33E|nr:type IV pilin N-terminal domain-containing protein [Halorubellus sp. JP-L1]NHN40108.1 type IV pilin [Halorubellus sp. JP-L1]
MKLTILLTEDDAVSSTIGVVLMVAVTVILAAAVGTFALGLAETSAEETPSASFEVEWGLDGGDTVVDVTMQGGNGVEAKFVTVELEGSEVWNDADEDAAGRLTHYDGKEWTADKIQSGDTLGLKEDGTSLNEGDTIPVIWNNGQKSQVHGSATLSN